LSDSADCDHDGDFALLWSGSSCCACSLCVRVRVCHSCMVLVKQVMMMVAHYTVRKLALHGQARAVRNVAALAWCAYR